RALPECMENISSKELSAFYIGHQHPPPHRPTPTHHSLPLAASPTLSHNRSLPLARRKRAGVRVRPPAETVASRERCKFGPQHRCFELSSGAGASDLFPADLVTLRQVDQSMLVQKVSVDFAPLRAPSTTQCLSVPVEEGSLFVVFANFFSLLEPRH